MDVVVRYRAHRMLSKCCGMYRRWRRFWPISSQAGARWPPRWRQRRIWPPRWRPTSRRQTYSCRSSNERCRSSASPLLERCVLPPQHLRPQSQQSGCSQWSPRVSKVHHGNYPPTRPCPKRSSGSPPVYAGGSHGLWTSPGNPVP